nr:leucine-rich repeat domain-containing protein [Candidatus Sigynarchaeum springense]
MIASPSGTGKTTLLRHFQHVLLEPSGGAKPVAAVWASDLVLKGMGVVSATAILEKLAIHYQNSYRAKCPGLAAEELMGFLSSGEAVLLVDGLDELVHGGRTGSLEDWFDALGGLASDLNARVLVSCRDTLFTSTGSLASYKDRVRTIAPWDWVLMRAWIERNAKLLDPPVKASPAEVLDTIRRIQPLEALCKVPFLLKSLVEIYPDLQGGTESLAKHEIYERLIAKKLQTRAGTLEKVPGLTPDMLRKLVQLLALDYLAGKEACFAVDGAALAAKVKDSPIFTPTERQSAQRLAEKDDRSGSIPLESYVRSCSLLEVSAGGCTFPHRSIAEYLLADAVARYPAARSVFFLAPFFTREALEFLTGMLETARSGIGRLGHEDIAKFFSEQCTGEVEHDLLKWMKGRVAEGNYTKEDFRKVVVRVLETQREVFLDKLIDPSIIPWDEVWTGLGKNKGVTALQLGSNGLSALPESIGNLEALQTLWLSSNQLSSLPERIGNLRSLQILWLNGNQLSFLPENIGQLKSLQKLWLEDNKLTSLPESIGNLEALQTLWLSSNQLSSLPKTIGNLKSLTYLTLNYNLLSSLPETIDNLKSLTYLTLNYNLLSSLPEVITRMTWLRVLDLDGNRLSSLPENIGQLTSLESLSLWGNQLSSLPETIGGIKSLIDLSLGFNQLSSLPGTIKDWIKTLEEKGCKVYR